MKRISKTIFLTLIVSLLFALPLLLTGCRDSSIDPEDLIAESTDIDVSSSITPNSLSGSETTSDSSSPTQVLNASLDHGSEDVVLAKMDTSLNLAGKILIDGAAMLSPITEKVSEEFTKTYPNTSIDVSISGTEEGIQAFLEGQIDLCSATRNLNKEEAATLKAGDGFIELKIAYDGIVLAVNKDCPVDTITLDEINAIWTPESMVSMWNEVNENWPEQEMLIYGPKIDSSLIGFFSSKILGSQSGEIGMYSEIENETELVECISGDNTAIAITSFSNYFANMDQLKALMIDSGSEPVLPSIESIKDGHYQVLSSPLYLYVNPHSLKREEVKMFVKYYLDNVSKIALSAGYVPLTDAEYAAQTKLLQ